VLLAPATLPLVPPPLLQLLLLQQGPGTPLGLQLGLVAGQLLTRMRMQRQQRQRQRRRWQPQVRARQQARPPSAACLAPPPLLVLLPQQRAQVVCRSWCQPPP
jgi:hypothetical protein